jgi:hypothetical protein
MIRTSFTEMKQKKQKNQKKRKKRKKKIRLKQYVSLHSKGSALRGDISFRYLKQFFQVYDFIRY